MVGRADRAAQRALGDSARSARCAVAPAERDRARPGSGEASAGLVVAVTRRRSAAPTARAARHAFSLEFAADLTVSGARKRPPSCYPYDTLTRPGPWSRRPDSGAFSRHRRAIGARSDSSRTAPERDGAANESGPASADTSGGSGVDGTASRAAGYDAKDITVLEGLEAVRKRPGHVHRLDRPAGPAPPRLRGRRQLRRRGAGGLLHRSLE